MWLRTPVPPEQRNFFYRGFKRVYARWSAAIRGSSARWCGTPGFMVIRGGAVGAWFWGLARLPTAFIPIDDQGYLMIAAQLPDAAVARANDRGTR